LAGVEAAAASDPEVASLSETALLAIEAIASPSWYSIAAAFLSAEAGGWTGRLFEALAYGALTDDNYKTAKATLIARRLLLPIGGALIIIGGDV
jgi:hypothetical protein